MVAVWAEMAKSGDPGSATGPCALAGRGRGPQFTVWNKQMNGDWNWLFEDGGLRPVTGLPPMDSGEALAQVLAVEEALAAVAVTDLKSGFLTVYADDGRMRGAVQSAAQDGDPAEAEMATRPAAARLTTLGGEASQAGDLVWTYGVMDWSGIGGETKGHYVRVWQRRAEGWRIVFDDLLLTPPPRPN